MPAFPTYLVSTMTQLREERTESAVTGKSSRVPAYTPESITSRAIAAQDRIADPRLRGLVQGLVKHLHAYVTELRPTDEEYEAAWTFLSQMAGATTPERNEFLFLLDVLGVSQLIDTLAHPADSGVGYSAVGPFYRADAPWRQRGASIASDDTPGTRVDISGRVYDLETGRGIAGATLDVWQAACNGLYENVDPSQPAYNLRGRFAADNAGAFAFVGVMPTAYPVPTDGPVGRLLEVAGRYPYRAAHIHFIVSAPGYETLVTHVFVEGDERIADDVVFIGCDRMLGRFVEEGDRRSLRYDFPLKHGVSRMPKPPLIGAPIH
jgi:catechol 1,2-dioxygenase